MPPKETKIETAVKALDAATNDPTPQTPVLPVETAELPEWAKLLLANQTKMAEELQMYKDKSKMLEDLAGKSQIADWKDRQKDVSIKRFHFKKWNDKPVIGWSKLDFKHFNPRAPSAELENVFLTLRCLVGVDAANQPVIEEEKVAYIEWVRVKDLVYAEVVGEYEKVKYLPAVPVKFENGTEVLVERPYLNA